ncbi:MAG: hypothetical protein PHY35_01810 [Candidatus Omnitrophica bacterium]|jgi:Flp pilus assembly pilin Flp|nr:hypothetical protein [Candidatus Omnitrophota bacterium]
MKFLRKGQNLVDLALLIGIVGLVIIGMETYIRRGLQGKLRDATDAIISKGQAASADEPDSKTGHTRTHAEFDYEEGAGGRKIISGTSNTTSDYRSTTVK